MVFKARFWLVGSSSLSPAVSVFGLGFLKSGEDVLFWRGNTLIAPFLLNKIFDTMSSFA
jgi:hypothetical protein